MRIHGSARSAALETGGVVRKACERHERDCGVAADLDPSERRLQPCKRRWLVWSTTSLFELAGEFWRTTLERHQKKLNGPKNRAKHIEAKQNRINKECKRVETESPKVAEMLESIRVRKLRADLLREGESMDKNRSHVLRNRETSNNKVCV